MTDVDNDDMHRRNFVYFFFQLEIYDSDVSRLIVSNDLSLRSTI